MASSTGSPTPAALRSRLSTAVTPIPPRSLPRMRQAAPCGAAQLSPPGARGLCVYAHSSICPGLSVAAGPRTEAFWEWGRGAAWECRGLAAYHSVTSDPECCRRRRPPPPARPPVFSQTIGDESQTGTRLAWDARLERGGQRRRDLGDSPPPSPHTSSPCVRTTPPANQSQLVCAKPIHPSTAPSLHPYRSPRHVWERRVGTCSHKHRRASFFVLMNPTKTPYPAPSREFDATSSISGTQRGCH